jgi:hypothetical protein
LFRILGGDIVSLNVELSLDSHDTESE